MHPLTVVWSDELAAYDFGPHHPLAPVRVVLTIDLARSLGVLDAPNVTMTLPDPCDDSMLELVHTKAFLAAVKAEVGNPAFGLGTPDVPVFDGMHAASARVVGATLAATRAVYEGRAMHAVNVAGGLHHAMPAAASGFCVYNDPAVAIAWLLVTGCAAGRVRRHRCSSRRRGAGCLLRRSAGAHDLAASKRADAVSRYRLP